MAATPSRSMHTLSSSPLLSPSAIIATLPARAPKPPAIPRADSLNRPTSIWDIPESDEDPVLEELPKKQPRKRAVKATTTEKKPRARKKDATLSLATNKDVRDGVKSKYFSGGVAEALEALGESLDVVPPAETAEPKPKTVRKRAPKKATGDPTAAPKPPRKKAEPKAKAAPKTKVMVKEKEDGNKVGNEAEATTGLEPIAEDTPPIPLPSLPRRRAWTPVLDTPPEPTETPLHTDADNVLPTDTPITSFGNKIGALRYSTSVSDTTSMQTDIRPLVLKKRPIEMVELPNPRPSPAEPVPKPKKPRKKPQTLTERASAQYRQEPGSPQPITQFFTTSKKTTASGKEKAATTTAGATGKRKNEEEATLVSPNTARQRLDRQEFVFGTLSQLEKQTVEDEEYLSPPRIQKEAELITEGTINRVVTASRGLWDAAGYRNPTNATNDAPAAMESETTYAAEHPQRASTPTLPDAPPVNPHPKPSDQPKPAVNKRYSIVDLTLSSSPAAKPALSKPKDYFEPRTWTIPSSSPKQLPQLQSSPMIAAAVTSFSSPYGWNIPPPIFSSQPSAKRAFTTTAAPEARRGKSSSSSPDQSFEPPPPSSPPPQSASKLVEPVEETEVTEVTPKRRGRARKVVAEAVEEDAVVADTPAPKPRSRSRKVVAEVVDVPKAPEVPVAALASESVELLPRSPSPRKRRTRSPSEIPVAKRRSVSRAATPMEAASTPDVEPTKLIPISDIENQKAEVLIDSEPVPAKKPRSTAKKAVVPEEPVTTPKPRGRPRKTALDTEPVAVVEIPASPEPEITAPPRKRRSPSPSESSPAKRQTKSRAKTPTETTEAEAAAERLPTPDIDDYLPKRAPKRAASVQPVVATETTPDIDNVLPQPKKTRKPRSASALPGSAGKRATTPDIDDILQSIKKPTVRNPRAKAKSRSPSRTRTPSRSRSRSVVSETEPETAANTKAKRTPAVRKPRARSVIPETDQEDNALSSPETTRKKTKRKSRSKSPRRSPRKKTVKRTPKLKPLAKELEEDLFKRIGAEVKKDKTPGGWFERMLMYDPIVVEELVDWLKERGVVRVLEGEVAESEAPKKKGRWKAKAKEVEEETEEVVKEPLAPIDEDVRAWCYHAGVCCVDTLTNGGKARKRL